MDRDLDLVAMALLGIGSVLLLVSAAGLFTGNPNVAEYVVPVALVGAVVTFLGVRRLERMVEPFA